MGNPARMRFRPNIATLRGYCPGEWPDPEAGVIKLNSNENPYPPSPQVLSALKDFQAELLRRYPDPRAQAFAHTVAERFEVPPNWVIAGNGSDDLLTLLVRACAQESSRPLAYPTPTYVLYRTLAEIQPAAAIEIPYGQPPERSDNPQQTWQLPVEKLLEAQAAVTFIASPNSPSGHGIPMADLKVLAAGLTGILVIDEAYVDFAGPGADRQNLALVRAYDNVILLRTLSKGYSLAGIRLGFGIAQPGLIAGLLKIKDSYNVDALALHLGIAALQDQAYKQTCAAKVIASRQHLAQALSQSGFEVWPSLTNFLLVRPGGSNPQAKARSLLTTLKGRNIWIRYFDQPGLDDKLRITVGTPAQNAQMLSVIERWLTA